jgi:ribosome biogenesis GTPase
LEKGLVIKSTGSHYRVMYGEEEIIECTIKGKFRVKGLRTTNPVAVGDNVFFDLERNKKSGIITEVLNRKNYILRKAINLSKETQIIAANIDYLWLMITIIMPETPVEFIDRFLITAEAYRIPAGIIINKTDLYGSFEREKMEYLFSLYTKIGYECFRLSLKERSGIEELKKRMKNKVSNPDLKLKTEEVSDYHKQGKHITTFPEMHRMPFRGFIIDSPGIRGFGVVDMAKNEIYHFFPEIFRISKNCRFYNCIHTDEPGCAVISAVESGEIDPLRYRSYLNILEDDNRKYR